LFLALAMVFVAIGNGFSRPALLGIVSVAAKDNEQGKIMGASQSAASLGRILGPILGGWLYTYYGMESPFLAASFVTVLGFIAILFKYSQLPDQRVVAAKPGGAQQGAQNE
jgi:MFS family permease